MSRHVIALPALWAFALASSSAVAQVIFSPGTQGPAGRSIEGRATERDDIYTCQGAPGGSRVRENCDAPETTTTTFRMEQELKFTIAPPPLPNAQCSATTTTQYQQRNTIARVNSALEIRDCTAASGTFTVALRMKDESGADQPLEFSEAWQRSDDEIVQFAADYPIGENMELVSVRLRGLTCTCADAAVAGTGIGEVGATSEAPLTEN